MIAPQRTTATALMLALLAACSDSPRHVPPVAKTNPEPRDRYEITVELVDPPPGIQGISGMANFSIPDVICMRSPDPIAGYTPGSHYEHPFELEPIGDNTYRGHIYLDWPIDEDYYGLGVCRWKLAAFEILMPRNGYTQVATFRQSDLQIHEPVGRLCRRERRMRPDEFCMIATEQNIEKLGDASFGLSVRAREDAP